MMLFPGQDAVATSEDRVRQEEAARKQAEEAGKSD